MFDERRIDNTRFRTVFLQGGLISVCEGTLHNVLANRSYAVVETEINRIYDGVKAETRISQASFQII